MIYKGELEGVGLPIIIIFQVKLYPLHLTKKAKYESNS